MGSLAAANNKGKIRRALQGGPMNVAEIAKATSLSRGVVRRWLDSLVQTKRVERLDGPGHAQYQLAATGPEQAAEAKRRRRSDHSVRPGSQYGA